MQCKLANIIRNDNICDNIYRLEVKFSNIIKPGQFFMLKTLDNSFFLPRPLSIHNVKENSIQFLYRIEGQGTERISKIIPNNQIQIFGPLGNGFNVDNIKGRIAIVGGGIGIAPLLYLTKKLKNKNIDMYLGFKDKVYCIDDFSRNTNKLIVSTDDGSYGKKGYITDMINVEDYDIVITCGPSIMMEKIIRMCNKKKIKVLASLESKMACGIGACLGCVIETKKGNQRVCKDGPVFDGKDLIL